jgi:hypothetical protein
MVEIWKAANTTKSNVIMYWWTPELLFESFVGTDAEFTRITLPNPTQTCVENRVYSLDRCPKYGIATVAQLAGSPEGACDDPPTSISKVISTGLHDVIFDPSIPDALRSPGYAAVKQFGMSNTQLSEVFQYWKRYGDPREAVCEWIVDNQAWAREFIPRTYPRTEKESTRSGPLQYVSYSLAGLAIAMVVITSTAVYHNRKRQEVVVAQVEFLFLLLAGLFVISLGSLMTSLSATDGTCVASIWFVNIGYSLELIPLLVKISAINRLMSAASSSRMKRVVLSRHALFGAVFLISLVVFIFLMIWTILDPPRESKEYVLGETDDIGEGDPTDILVTTYCSSEKDFWSYISFAWIGGMLVAATVLAIQSRNTRQDFNESQTLGVMIYSHFVFVILRVAIHTLPTGVLSREVLVQYQSIIFSLDTIATLVVYFFPKFRKSSLQRDSQFRTSSMMRFSSKSLKISYRGFEKGGDETRKSTAAMTLPRGRRYRCTHCGKCMDAGDLIEVLAPTSEEGKGGTEERGKNSVDLVETSGCFTDMPRQQGHCPDPMQWSTSKDNSVLDA